MSNTIIINGQMQIISILQSQLKEQGLHLLTGEEWEEIKILLNILQIKVDDYEDDISKENADIYNSISLILSRESKEVQECENCKEEPGKAIHTDDMKHCNKCGREIKEEKKEERNCENCKSYNYCTLRHNVGCPDWYYWLSKEEPKLTKE